MPSSTTPGSPIIDSSSAAMSTWPSPRVDRLGTPKAPAIRFTRAMTFVASWFTHLLRPARLLAPRYGSDHLRGQRGGFQRDEPVAGYDYSSDWTPLLTGLSPARMAASLAAPTPSIVVDLHHLLLAGLPAHFESSHASHAVGSLPVMSDFKPARSTAEIAGTNGLLPGAPASANVGTSGHSGVRCPLVTASARSFRDRARPSLSANVTCLHSTQTNRSEPIPHREALKKSPVEAGLEVIMQKAGGYNPARSI